MSCSLYVRGASVSPAVKLLHDNTDETESTDQKWSFLAENCLQRSRQSRDADCCPAGSAASAKLAAKCLI